MAAYTLRNIDDDLWAEVKSLAALKRMSIKEFILTLLEQAVQENKKKSKK